MRRRDPWTCPECKGKIRKRPGRPPRKCDDCKGELEQKRPRVNTGYQGEPPVPPPRFSATRSRSSSNSFAAASAPRRRSTRCSLTGRAN